MDDVVRLDFKIKKDELFGLHCALEGAREDLVEAMEKHLDCGMLTYEVMEKGVKGIDRVMNEVELYWEV